MFLRLDANFGVPPSGSLRRVKHQFYLRILMLFIKNNNFTKGISCFWPPVLSWGLWATLGSPWGLHLSASCFFYLPLGSSLEVSGAPLAPFSHFCYSCVMSFLFLHVLFISFRVCFPGRPDSRMYCPDIIGRDSWVWDEQETLYKNNSPHRVGE